jgi:hypothetical protein
MESKFHKSEYVLYILLLIISLLFSYLIEVLDSHQVHDDVSSSTSIFDGSAWICHIVSTRHSRSSSSSGTVDTYNEVRPMVTVALTRDRIHVSM